MSEKGKLRSEKGLKMTDWGEVRTVTSESSECEEKSKVDGQTNREESAG